MISGPGLEMSTNLWPNLFSETSNVLGPEPEVKGMMQPSLKKKDNLTLTSLLEPWLDC